jgi:hypothetical protein
MTRRQHGRTYSRERNFINPIFATADTLRLQFDAISHMPENEQAIILELLEGMIIKYETRRRSTQRRN